MIPKVLHTVWVGTDMPSRERDLWAKNREVLEGYDIHIIRESIVPDNLKPYLNYVWQTKKWAFVSDILKVLALKKFGGWVSDADVEFFKTLDGFNSCWVSGFENWRGHILANTAVWGAIPEHKFTNKILDIYLTHSPEDIMRKPNTKWISDILVENGAKIDNTEQYIESVDVKLYPHEIFCGPKSEKSVSVHHFNGSWL